MVVAPCLYSGFPKELPKAAMKELPQPEICPIHNRQELKRPLVYIFHIHVVVKIVGRPDLADWKTKICLIIVLKQVEEKVSA